MPWKMPLGTPGGSKNFKIFEAFRSIAVRAPNLGGVVINPYVHGREPIYFDFINHFDIQGPTTHFTPLWCSGTGCSPQSVGPPVTSV